MTTAKAPNFSCPNCRIGRTWWKTLARARGAYHRIWVFSSKFPTFARYGKNLFSHPVVLDVKAILVSEFYQKYSLLNPLNLFYPAVFRNHSVHNHFNFRKILFPCEPFHCGFYHLKFYLLFSESFPGSSVPGFISFLFSHSKFDNLM